MEAFKKGLDGEIAVVEKTSPIPVEQENASSWDEKIKKADRKRICRCSWNGGGETDIL